MKLSKLISNPFERIAGYEALLIGVVGIALNSLLGYLSKMHSLGILHFGPASNQEFWVFATENIIIWLVPAIIFYIAGLLFTKSHIRIVDVLGTTAFAKLPLILMCILWFTPPLQQLVSIDPNATPDAMKASVDDINMIAMGAVSILSIAFFAWSYIWLYNAMKVSCNLKGLKGALVYIFAIIGGDILTVWIISYIK